MKNDRWVILMTTVLFSIPLYAHRPVADPGTAVTASTAIAISEPDVSQVVYHKVTARSPYLWLTLTADAGYQLYVSIGVPVIERLRTYRPALVLLGPGLPAVQLPFETPAAIGGVVFATDSVKPSFFHEPVTGTDSWILLERTIELPRAGRYYIVAYSPVNEAGKLWVAVGTKERFGIRDIFALPEWRRQIRQFHEVR